MKIISQPTSILASLIVCTSLYAMPMTASALENASTKLSVTKITCGFWGQRLFLNFSSLQGKYSLAVPRGISCQNLATGLHQQISALGNRLNASIRSYTVTKSKTVCTSDGEDNDQCHVEYYDVTYTSIALPELQVGGQAVVVTNDN
jgi:hypothetical protein